MKKSFHQNFKLGVLGGGQLGRMLIQSGIDFNIQFALLDPDPKAPCSTLGEFHVGKLTDFETVMKFGADCDVITIEIENVNTAALRELQRQGKKVYPQPDVIELIQDKRVQKEFYRKNNIPTADFILTENANDVSANKHFLPAVNKLGKEGYDGRGVQILRTEKDLAKAFDAPGLLEKLIDFDKEISVIVARNESGELKTFPVVEMVFHPVHNLVEYLFAPATISNDVQRKADDIAKKIITELNMIGLLAVEMFVTKDGNVLVNEVAPRPHNSGHQTIEGNVTSQYEQHLRAILNLPLGDTKLISPSAMVNLLGEDGFNGPAVYEGFEEVVSVSGVHVHLYGKTITKPFRKMGHVTIMDEDLVNLKKKATFVKETLKVKPDMKKPEIGIIMGSDSDLTVMKEAAQLLDELSIPYELTVVSAHRTPLRMVEYATKARANGLKVIIAGAGGAAHLPGMVASLTTLPVIGVPVKSSNSIDGWDSILSILQMPGGVPVATVALNGAKNAGILAAQILGSNDLIIAKSLENYKEIMREKVESTAKNMDSKGWKAHLK